MLGKVVAAEAAPAASVAESNPTSALAAVRSPAAASVAVWPPEAPRLLPPLRGGLVGRSGSVDVAAAVAHEFPVVTHGYCERDAALYALSVGATADDRDLKFVYEDAPDGEF